MGIDCDDAEHVFGMSNRPHGKAVPGPGIGRALFLKVVERLGGRIWVESEVGQGAVFKFTISAEEQL
jgi:signal transduction histidine kinase